MENRKFYIDGIYKFAHLEDVKGVITEEKPDESILEILYNYGTEII
jgi:DeoR family glycerol-3-phosphate regulon repressor